MASVTCSNLGGKQPENNKVQHERNEDEIVHGAHERDREIDRIERVEPEHDDRRQQPEGSARVPQREHDEAQILRNETPEPEQAKH